MFARGVLLDDPVHLRDTHQHDIAISRGVNDAQLLASYSNSIKGKLEIDMIMVKLSSSSCSMSGEES